MFWAVFEKIKLQIVKSHKIMFFMIPEQARSQFQKNSGYHSRSTTDYQYKIWFISIGPFWEKRHSRRNKCFETLPPPGAMVQHHWCSKSKLFTLSRQQKDRSAYQSFQNFRNLYCFFLSPDVKCQKPFSTPLKYPLALFRQNFYIKIFEIDLSD